MTVLSAYFSIGFGKAERIATKTEQWPKLNEHFHYHGSVVRRIARANAQLVLHMWQTSQNEFGKPLSSFEREALIERHCELFGTWPT